MQIKYVALSPGGSPGLLRKLAGLFVTVALVALGLMFSVVLFAVILVVGTIALAYLWWKTRELRKQMRDFRARATAGEEKAAAGNVFEGEVIRVDEPRDGK